MSAIPSDDALRIPLEVQVEDIQELQQLIQELEKAEDIQKDALLPRKGKIQDSSSRSAFTSTQPFDERGGIFGTGIGETPFTPKDKTSRAPIQKTNQFSEMQNRLAQVEETQTDMSGVINNVATGLGFGFLNNVQNPQSIISGAKGVTAQAGKGGIASMLKGGIMGGLPLAALFGSIEFITMIVDLLQAPGGPFDKRFKRVIQDEIASATERAEKAEISQGLKIVRMSSYAGFRGEAANVAGAAVARGQPIYSPDREFRSKGV